MAEKIISEDEAKKIALEHIIQKENVGDVTITNIVLHSDIEPYIYELDGVIRRHALKYNIDYIIEEFQYKLLISNIDKKIRYYKLSERVQHHSVRDLINEQQLNQSYDTAFLNDIRNTIKKYHRKRGNKVIYA